MKNYEKIIKERLAVLQDSIAHHSFGNDWDVRCVERLSARRDELLDLLYLKDDESGAENDAR